MELFLLHKAIMKYTNTVSLLIVNIIKQSLHSETLWKKKEQSYFIACHNYSDIFLRYHSIWAIQKWEALSVWTGCHFHFPLICKQMGVQELTFENSNNVMFLPISYIFVCFCCSFTKVFRVMDYSLSYTVRKLRHFGESLI